MITAVIRGGLGNQLFQYASAYALARRLEQPLVIDTSFFPKQTLRGYKLDSLRIIDHEVSNRERDGLMLKIYKNKNLNGIIRRSAFRTLPFREGKYLIDHVGSYTPFFFEINEKNVLLNGYFQSEEYFLQYRKELLTQLLPRYELEEEYVLWLNRIRTTESVAIHVRHGDFGSDTKSTYHYVLPTNYYNNSLSIIRNQIQTPEFFCFSDDIQWVKENIGGAEKFHFVSLSTAHADIDEMMLMKNCSHIITANSTFSWWAAWLNEHEDAIRIVPAKAYGNDHMIPASWYKIGVNNG